MSIQNNVHYKKNISGISVMFILFPKQSNVVFNKK